MNMHRYQKLLVALNLNEQDEATIHYASLVAQMAGSRCVHFLHVIRTDQTLAKAEVYRNLIASARPAAEAKIAEAVAARFRSPDGIEVIQDVREGVPITEVLRAAREEEIDLIVVGRKAGKASVGDLPERVTRKAPCSVLIVPEQSRPRIDRILVPVDFSDHSADAVDVAVAFAKAREIREITCLHAYNVPIPSSYVMGEGEAELAEAFRQYAGRAYDEFIEPFRGRGVDFRILLRLESEEAKAILDAADEEKADLVVVGTRGTSAATVLLGSVTEQLIWTTKVPLLAAKRKGSNWDLLSLLLG